MSASKTAAEPTPSPRTVARGLAARWHVWVLDALVAAGAVAAWVYLPNRSALLSAIAVAGLFALSIDVLVGFAGVLTLGPAAFYGLGAYATALAANAGVGEPLTGLALAALAAAAGGLATSVLLVRGPDLTRLAVTLGVALVLGEIAKRLPGLTGGPAGLKVPALGPLLGRFRLDLDPRMASGYALGVLGLAVIAMRRLTTSNFGLALKAIRDNPARAGALGLPVGRRLVAACTLAAAIAGIAGGLQTEITGAVAPDVFSLYRSAEGLLMLLTGGAGYLYGGILGAVVVVGLEEGLKSLPPVFTHATVGGLLIALTLVGRRRIEALPGRLLAAVLPKRIARRRGRRRAVETAPARAGSA